MKKFIYILVSLLVFGSVYFFLGDILRLFPQFSGIEKVLKEVSSELQIEKVKKDISSPPPLRATKESPESFLASSGVITWTNIQRNRNGLLPFTENEKLNTAAFLKVQDMFERQYFGHISPSGTDAGDLAETVEYQFIAIGENLALGNFENNEALVQAWMDSPGHRANILSSRYIEIGAAVAKGIFEGKKTWIAVQEFGLPLSVCPAIEKSLIVKIRINEDQLQKLEGELAVKQRELRSTRPKWGPAYNRKVDGYNVLVAQYNSLSGTTKTLINEYNNQVKEFNVCVAI